MGGFVKLDQGLLNSTLWVDEIATRVFLTAMLMADPMELREPVPQLELDTTEETGWVVPPGWYGFVPAAAVGIIARAMIDRDRGFEALATLGSPEACSRSPDFDGRRLVRVPGGFLVLNWEKYRERDYTAAERSRRWRERQKQKRAAQTDTRDRDADTRDITQAEAEAEAEKLTNQPGVSVVPGQNGEGIPFAVPRAAFDRDGRVRSGR